MQRILFVCFLLTFLGLSLALSIQIPRPSSQPKERFLITTTFNYFNCDSLDNLKSITIQPVTSRNEFNCHDNQCYTTIHWDVTMNHRCVYSEFGELFLNYSMPLAIDYMYQSNGGCKVDQLVEIDAYPAESCLIRNHLPLSYECKDGFYYENNYNGSIPTTSPCQPKYIVSQKKIPIDTCTENGHVYNCNQK